MKFLESIKIADSKPQNLEYHLSRMQANGFKQDIEHLFHNSFPASKFMGSLVKWRIIYDHKEIFSCEFLEYKLPTIKSLRVINSQDLNYSRKYLDRESINHLFSQRGNADDVLICKDGLVGDTSFCNTVFKRKEQLFTPDSPILAGTKRQFLIDNGLITPCKITIDDIQQFDGLFLINSMIELRDEAYISVSKIFSCF